MSTKTDLEEVLTKLRLVGLKITEPRLQIVKQLLLLSAAQSDFTIEQLYQSVQEKHAKIGRATVFRLIDDMMRIGIVDRIGFADGSHTYRMCSLDESHASTHHHHLTCSECHRIIEIEVCLPEQTLSRIAANNNFTLAGHTLEVFGLCQECAEKQ